MDSGQILKIISRAWGRQKGYCFFPTISGTAKDKRERIMSYREGQAFYWPKDRDKIISHLDANRSNDVYWCPSLFEMPRRKMELAMDEHALWADLDEVDPRNIDDYPPTIAWETSPGRYQALWVIVGGDMQGASWHGRENQKLTYLLGADESGWDTTQLLRLPSWYNHKPEYRKKGKPVEGRLLFTNGRQYLPDEFGELPDVPTGAGEVVSILEDEIDHVDRHEVWGRVRLKVSTRVREFMAAKEASGDRSDVLWEMERELADAGCTATEIVALVRNTPWNKYDGRSDELRRLAIEAAKAISQRSEETSERLLEEIQQRPAPTNLFTLVRNLKTPPWLVRDVLTEGAVGFIAGQPKSFKSWVGLDMALSVASGQPFLGHFAVERPGPTLYIQEEDSAPLLKSRLGKVWPSKVADKLVIEDEDLYWLPAVDDRQVNGGVGCDIDAYVGQTFTISDVSWQSWLDETLSNKAEQVPGGYRLLVLDPLMMMAGEVDENRAQEMTTKIFRPLKELARKHNLAIQIVHHLRKYDGKNGPIRGGQLLLGSVANHAWAEDSMYFRLNREGIVCEQESKNAPVPGFKIVGIRNRRWDPRVIVNVDASSDHEGDAEGSPGNAEGRSNARNSRRYEKREKGEGRVSKPMEALMQLPEGPHTVREIADKAGVSIQSVYSALKRYQDKGLVEKVGTMYQRVTEN